MGYVLYINATFVISPTQKFNHISFYFNLDTFSSAALIRLCNIDGGGNQEVERDKSNESKKNSSFEGRSSQEETRFHARPRFVPSYSPSPHFHASDHSFRRIVGRGNLRFGLPPRPITILEEGQPPDRASFAQPNVGHGTGRPDIPIVAYLPR
jgi:hypothetical protein